jgi:predicted ArsR family transcriptional regulator
MTTAVRDNVDALAVSGRWLHRVASREQALGTEAVAVAVVLIGLLKHRPLRWLPVRVAAIAKETGLHRNRVVEALDSLQALGLLQRLDEGDTGAGKRVSAFRISAGGAR